MCPSGIRRESAISERWDWIAGSRMGFSDASARLGVALLNVVLGVCDSMESVLEIWYGMQMRENEKERGGKGEVKFFLIDCAGGFLLMSWMELELGCWMEFL